MGSRNLTVETVNDILEILKRDEISRLDFKNVFVPSICSAYDEAPLSITEIEHLTL